MKSSQTITNLVFDGGGVDAIAYASFLSAIAQEGLLSLNQIQRVAGVSSGAIAALQVALNYSTDEMMATVNQTDFSHFADVKGGIIGEVFNLFTEDGLYKEEFLYGFISNLIKAKTGDENVTFHDLQNMKAKQSFKDLYVIATKLFILNNQPIAQAVTFSHEQTPFARVIDAVRASASLPIIFPPVRLLRDENDHYLIHANGDVYIDGGVIESYPIRLFDSPRYFTPLGTMQETSSHSTMLYNPETLGLRLESQTQLDILKDKTGTEHNITSPFQYAEALLYVLRKGQQETYFANSPDRSRTVLIDTLNIPSTQFNLSTQEKEALLEAGRKAALQLAQTQSIHS